MVDTLYDRCPTGQGWAVLSGLLLQVACPKLYLWPSFLFGFKMFNLNTLIFISKASLFYFLIRYLMWNLLMFVLYCYAVLMEILFDICLTLL